MPYASAPSHGWHDVPALGELIFHGLDVAGGARGLLAAQVVAVAAAFALLATDARRAGASDERIALVLLALVVATFPSLAEIRAQLFSLALFPLLLLLVRSEARRPSRRVFLLAPLVALWSNLHGAVLTGLAVAVAYLVLDRARREPVVALAALAACAVGLFATPALWQTGTYYEGVLRNEAARRGIGLWRPLRLDSGFDLAFIVCVVLLALAAWRARRPLWEVIALVGLAALTVQAARGGVWLAFLLAAPAAVGLRRPARRAGSALVAPLLTVAVLVAVLGIVKGPNQAGASTRLVHETLVLAHGTPVLAADQLAEQVALAGGRIWIGNPIDAFRHADQRAYVDWLEGRAAGDDALQHAPRAVLVRPGSPPDPRLAARRAFREVARDGGAVLYARVSARG